MEFQFDPELVLVSAGFDSARGDPKVRDSFNLMTAEFLEKFSVYWIELILSFIFKSIVTILVLLVPPVFAVVLLLIIVLTLTIYFLVFRCK